MEQPNLTSQLLRRFSERVPDGFRAEGYVPVPGSDHVVDLRYKSNDGSMYVLRVDTRNEKVMRAERLDAHEMDAREYGPVLRAPKLNW